MASKDKEEKTSEAREKEVIIYTDKYHWIHEGDPKIIYDQLIERKDFVKLPCPNGNHSYVMKHAITTVEIRDKPKLEKKDESTVPEVQEHEEGGTSWLRNLFYS